MKYYREMPLTKELPFKFEGDPDSEVHLETSYEK